jgi:hypothetical protein
MESSVRGHVLAAVLLVFFAGLFVATQANPPVTVPSKAPAAKPVVARTCSDSDGKDIEMSGLVASSVTKNGKTTYGVALDKCVKIKGKGKKAKKASAGVAEYYCAKNNKVKRVLHKCKNNICSNGLCV